ncbi:hypothetical protein Nepgr_012461 [Nepenthes gracilis]|uniref:Uncharacterized protein n=1 Tax=Nepenthes gracilis TaxID=150966 RepID=A0AAD3XND3_NEPGR|nr:hypothetical protein Nepgr_012461 [Nepenthes gracilis]
MAHRLQLPHGYTSSKTAGWTKYEQACTEPPPVTNSNSQIQLQIPLWISVVKVTSTYHEPHDDNATNSIMDSPSSEQGVLFFASTSDELKACLAGRSVPNPSVLLVDYETPPGKHLPNCAIEVLDDVSSERLWKQLMEIKDRRCLDRFALVTPELSMNAFRMVILRSRFILRKASSKLCYEVLDDVSSSFIGKAAVEDALTIASTPDPHSLSNMIWL